MNFHCLRTSLFFSALTIVSLWTNAVFASNLEVAENNVAEEFEALKKQKSQEIWNAEDMTTRAGYMQGITSGFFQCRINTAWSEFYSINRDPSGRSWALGPNEQYDLDGNITTMN